jgi:hypothetical protein
MNDACVLAILTASISADVADVQMCHVQRVLCDCVKSNDDVLYGVVERQDVECQNGFLRLNGIKNFNI